MKKEKIETQTDQNEYIIVNKTVLEKRIEELETVFKGKVGYNMALGEIQILKQILSQSTPLIPEIEKAFDAGLKSHMTGYFIYLPEHEDLKKDYISNLWQ